MKTYSPDYYKNFNCLADKCPDTCCAQWEIIVDDETFAKYSLLTDKYKDIIIGSISKNSEGENCFNLINGRCPFLNSDNLCDIHINLGKDYTCAVCQEHPLFIEEYDGFTEISPSLSCPETCDLVFGSNYSSETYPCPDYCGDDECLSILINSRKDILENTCDFPELINYIIDNVLNDELEINQIVFADLPKFTVENIIEYLQTLYDKCEILTENWKTLLENACNNYKSDKNMADYYNDNNAELCKICNYFVYRYYLKAVNDLDIYSRGLFIIFSCLACAYISSANNIPLRDSARIYSKETEHNNENIDIILDFLAQI